MSRSRPPPPAGAALDRGRRRSARRTGRAPVPACSASTGTIWPVHPTRAEFDGVPCFPSPRCAARCPGRRVPRRQPPCDGDGNDESRRIGAGGAVCYGSGFAEAGDDGRRCRRDPRRRRRRRCPSSARTATATSTRSTSRALARRARLPATRPGRGDRRPERQRRAEPHVPAARSAARLHGHGRQSGRRRDRGLPRGVARRRAGDGGRHVPRGQCATPQRFGAALVRAAAQGVPVVALAHRAIGMPALGSPPRTRLRSPGTRPRTPRCSSATA